MNPMRTTTLPGGTAVPLLGQGTWRMGEDREHRRREVSALRTGMELGMTLIDTAELYADGFAQLLADEKIAYAGVSNFDVQDMDELARLKDGLDIIVANEVLYNLEKRGIEYDLLPWMRKRHRPVIAYSPIEEGLLAGGTH